jgi:hypothetical protein
MKSKDPGFAPQPSPGSLLKKTLKIQNDHFGSSRSRDSPAATLAPA